MELFKDIEAHGGLLEQLQKGTIQQKIAQTAQKEAKAFASKEQGMVGVNIFMDGQDNMKGNLELYPFQKRNPRKTAIVPLLGKRLAAEAEKKRLDGE